jgi:hypothetical protein
MTQGEPAAIDNFLRSLKPFYDAGLINALGVVATLAAVLVALIPTFWKWKKRPKLVVLLKTVVIKNIAGNSVSG